MSSTNPESAAVDPLTVYYDGSCPLCRREIEAYRRLKGGDEIRWHNVCDPEARLGADLSREAALARFHVRDADGRLLSGASAFVALWQALPLLRPLAVVADLPPFRWIGEPLYRVFLRVRPGLQKAFRR